VLQDLFVNAAILIAFISLLQQFFKDKAVGAGWFNATKLQIGLVTALLAVLLMVYTVQVTDTIIMDFRNIPIIIAAVYAGLPAAILPAVAIGVFRIINYGISMASIIACLIAISIGLGCGLIALMNISRKMKWIYSVLFALLNSTVGFSLVLKSSPILPQLLLFYSLGFILLALFTQKYIEFMLKTTKGYQILKKSATIDFLTGLTNIREFDVRFNQIMNSAQRQDRKVSLLYIDIDYFKKVNDTHGHANGDRVLKELAAIFKRECRSYDVISRYGGEEFVVLLDDCPVADAVQIAERIRSAVEQHRFMLTDGQVIQITVSIGVATYLNRNENYKEIIEEADTALYEAKRSGRNRVILAQKGALSIDKI